MEFWGIEKNPWFPYNTYFFRTYGNKIQDAPRFSRLLIDGNKVRGEKMRDKVQNRALIFILTLVFGVALCGAAAAAPPGSHNGHFYKTNHNSHYYMHIPHYYWYCPPYVYNYFRSHHYKHHHWYKYYYRSHNHWYYDWYYYRWSMINCKQNTSQSALEIKGINRHCLWSDRSKE